MTGMETIEHHELVGEWADCWWACEHPERPFDPQHTAITMDCYSCWIAGVAACRHGHGAALGEGRNQEIVTLHERLMKYGHELGWFDRSGIEPTSL